MQFVNPKHLQYFNEKQAQSLVFSHGNSAYHAYLITEAFKQVSKTVFVVLPNLYEAEKYYDLLSQMLPAEHLLFYPVDQTLTQMMALGSPEFRSERLFTLYQLLTGTPHVVVTTQQGALLRQLTPSDYRNSKKTYKKQHDYDIQDIQRYLVMNGYQKTYMVERPGEFATRGHIIDFYALNYKEPVRLDFFGDTLESIKTFDVITQRSTAQLDVIDIMPMNELFYTDDLLNQARFKLNQLSKKTSLSNKEEDKLNQDIEALETRTRLDQLHLYVPLFNEQKTTVLDFANNYLLLLIEPSKMKLNELNKTEDLKTYDSTMEGSFFSSLLGDLTLNYLVSKPHISFETFVDEIVSSASLQIGELPTYKGNITLFLHDLEHTYKDYDVFLYYEDPKLLDQLQSLKFQDHIHPIKASITGSFIDHDQKKVFVSERDLYSKQGIHRAVYRSVIYQATKIRDASDLNQFDFVVHYDYGIGQYIGLKTMELGKEKRDYLHLIYANDEALYVPMDQIDRVLKYQHEEGARPKLSKLGTKQWTKTKESVKAKIKDLSDRLLKLYAIREQSEGYAFEHVEELEQDFERDFPYVPTTDQEKAIIETLHDMSMKRPMDRLICGDVGFGKTEVALRAAFKAVANAKQVMVLVPTTVLARQHYYTFKERFEKFGVTIGLLSRFVTKKQQTETIDKFKKGYVDIIVGTHRLLSEDVIPKSLGLFIIDEEQRFGVEQKEKIREIKQNVDTLTLSATPIPRTLQMSFMGLKDVSMIETPPKNRYPVQTYLVARNDALIKESIEREIARGGQVFYLYNRVETMPQQYHKLQNLIPNARIGVAHGKMKRQELEEVLSQFIDHEYDVLISTTIIETGIDIPNSNTLIIHEADKLGLAQLYQIRGRVGRSDKIAYAYLFYDTLDMLSDEAKKRLTAIQDFTALGSGYKIALRDLAIRGAGDILGQEQSGFIDTVGYDLYMKLLEETMTGQKAFKDIPSQDNEIFAPRHVDPEYVDHDTLRIEIHKRIASIHSMNDAHLLKQELTDRFGPVHPELQLYMYEKLFKKLSYELGIQKTEPLIKIVKFVLTQDATEQKNNAAFFQKGRSFKVPVDMYFEHGHLVIEMTIYEQKAHWLYLACELLEWLKEAS